MGQMGRGRRARGAVCAALALAGVVAPGCSRSGLDDEFNLRTGTPGAPGTPSSDAASASDDGSSATSSSSSGGDDGGDIFMNPPDDAPDFGDGKGGDGQGHPGNCGPATCGGCCTPSGVCQPGFDTSACGNGGQPCTECEPERVCTSAGVCG
jgi:hypothetical protein